MANFQANVPLINSPFVDKNGNITEAWFIFLVQLFRRTGGTGGGDGNLTLADVLSLEAIQAPISVIGADSLIGEAIFGAVEPKDSLPEMVFAPVSGASVSGGSIADQMFSSGVDFTPGTTAALSLSATFANAAQLWVFFDGIFQGDDQYSLSGVTLTFTSAIPIGVSKVYVKGLR
jgi:hypothetical protein